MEYYPYHWKRRGVEKRKEYHEIIISKLRPKLNRRKYEAHTKKTQVKSS